MNWEVKCNFESGEGKVLGKFTVLNLKLMWYSLLGIMKLELSVSFTYWKIAIII